MSAKDRIPAASVNSAETLLGALLFSNLHGILLPNLGCLLAEGA